MTTGRVNTASTPALEGYKLSIEAARAVRSVVMVTPWFPDRPDDFQAAYIYESAASIARSGISVSVLVCRPFFPVILARIAPGWMRGKVETSAFTQLHRVQVERYFGLAGSYLRPVTNFFQALRVEPALKVLARETNASLIHAQTEGMAPIAIRAAEELQIPAITTIHGLNTNPDYLYSKRQKNLLAPALLGMNKLVLVGEPLRETFAAYLGREDYFRVVPNGVSLPSRERTHDIFEGSTAQLVSVSNLHEGKGIDIALDALSLLVERGVTNWCYTIIGDGSERSSLEIMARERGLIDQVHFRGFLPRAEVFDTLLRSDIFVLPSYREAFGIAYLEAMACGLPTIGIRGQGPEAFIEQRRSGYLVEPRSPEAIADCVVHILERPSEAKEMGRRARERARQFSWDSHASRLIEVYSESIGREPS